MRCTTLTHKWFTKFLTRVDNIYFGSLSGLSSFKTQPFGQIYMLIILDDFIKIYVDHVYVYMHMYQYANIHTQDAECERDVF